MTYYYSNSSTTGHVEYLLRTCAPQLEVEVESGARGTGIDGEGRVRVVGGVQHRDDLTAVKEVAEVSEWVSSVIASAREASAREPGSGSVRGV